MCKIMALVGIRAGVNPKVMNKFLKTAAANLTNSDRDGFGYAGINQFGLFGERWLNVEEAFVVRRNPPKDFDLLSSLGGTLAMEDTYNSFGKFNPRKLNEASSLLLHARASTNTVSLANTHPFVMDDAALIHNGMVTSKELWNHISTCDSELILQAYQRKLVQEYPENLQAALDMLSGWWAVACLAKDPRIGSWVVDIFKDGTTSLYYSEIRELGGAHVYCTSQDILLDVLGQCRLKTPKIYKVKGHSHVRFDAITGAFLLSQELKPRVTWESPIYSDGWEGYGHWEDKVGDEVDLNAEDRWAQDSYEAMQRSMTRSERKGLLKAKVIKGGGY